MKNELNSTQGYQIWTEIGPDWLIEPNILKTNLIMYRFVTFGPESYHPAPRCSGDLWPCHAERAYSVDRHRSGAYIT